MTPPYALDVWIDIEDALPAPLWMPGLPDWPIPCPDALPESCVRVDGVLTRGRGCLAFVVPHALWTLLNQLPVRGPDLRLIWVVPEGIADLYTSASLVYARALLNDQWPWLPPQQIGEVTPTLSEVNTARWVSRLLDMWLFSQHFEPPARRQHLFVSKVHEELPAIYAPANRQVAIIGSFAHQRETAKHRWRETLERIVRGPIPKSGKHPDVYCLPRRSIFEDFHENQLLTCLLEILSRYLPERVWDIEPPAPPPTPIPIRSEGRYYAASFSSMTPFRE